MSNNTYKLAALPRPTRTVGLLARPNAPFVMANLLQFREKAKSKRFAGMTGKEAYDVYGESAMKAQGAMGSRMIWASEDVQKIAGSDAPNFEAIAFLEYASPKSFLNFLLFKDHDSSARFAGLKGQWLLASTTLEESDDKGLVGVALVELFSIKAAKRREDPDWFDTWKDVKLENGGTTTWEGSADSQLMGSATKTPSKIVVTQFPDIGSLQNGLATEAASTIKDLAADRLEDYLAYQAYPTNKWRDLLAKGTE
jgi:uncharacterized protein (DUF1330 family)